MLFLSVRQIMQQLVKYNLVEMWSRDKESHQILGQNQVTSLRNSELGHRPFWRNVFSKCSLSLLFSFLRHLEISISVRRLIYFISTVRLLSLLKHRERD